jgi:hypothetical protein
MNKIQQLEQQNIDIISLERSALDQLIQLSCQTMAKEKAVAQWNAFYAQHESGERFVAVIKKDTRIVGYGSLLAESSYQFFIEHDVFEIADVWIAKPERQQGLATLLISYFESIAHDEQATHIGMGIPLYAAYGPAHCLAVRLGYLPDGQGMTYQGVPVAPNKQYMINNDLRLWFVKELSGDQDQD